ncbi:MAG: peptidoglycan-binding domain-containing protein [Candidatus Parcubacteria bacterium]|nr:peptidoglycan-binding domain-containing protein [Candidatus Parcubacteria bacterium]
MVKKIFPILILVFVFLPFFNVHAENTLGQSVNFYVESSYDLTKRSNLSATLVKISPQLYFYIDDIWWSGLSEQSKTETKDVFDSLAEEFENKIYPSLTQTFGAEWNPGIDNDRRITILFHSMLPQAGGYFSNGNEYPKIQFPQSNEREMFYLNSSFIDSPLIKGFLAHEFIHLITFNQKDKKGVEEEVWLNEARAEYVSTFLGYDSQYEESNLQRRVLDFTDRPFDSLTEWKGTAYDYGVLNLFFQYLVDHYGSKILVDSLHLKTSGIKSINDALIMNSFKENFSQIFNDWAITVLINDCNVSQKYCYFNPNLKNLRITPMINYLPFIGESTLSVTNTTKDWAGNWHKFIGGNGTLRLEFSVGNLANFKVPYLIQDSGGNYTIGFLVFNKDGIATTSVSDFGGENTSLTIIPIAQTKISGFFSNEVEPSYAFFWSASTAGKTIPIPVPDEKPIGDLTVEALLEKIAQLTKMVADLQNQLNALNTSKDSCLSLNADLFYGLSDNNSVKCLQEFLKSQGSAIYPEGFITGNFFSLTELAVIRFQEKYASEILSPLGMTEGTGYVGIRTRNKINQLLTK